MARRINWEGRWITVPENASDEHVAAILQSVSAQFAKPEDAPVVGGVPGGTPQEPPPQPSLTETIMSAPAAVPGVVDMSGRGIAEGLMIAAGMPMDLVNIAPMAANILPGVEGVGPVAAGGTDIIGGSQSLMKAADWANQQTARLLGVEPPNPEPENLAERIVHRTGEEVGAAAPFALGALARAKRLGGIGARELAPRIKQPINPMDVFRSQTRSGGGGAAAVAGTAGQVGKEALARMFAPAQNVADTMTKAAAADPYRFMLKESAGATTAGAGASIANEYSRATSVDPNSNTAKAQDLVGAITGVAVGGGGIKALQGLNTLVKSLFSKSYMDQTVIDDVVDRIAKSGLSGLEPGQPIDVAPLVEAIERNPKIAETIPGVVESMADRTRNSGLSALEYQRQSAANAGMFKQRRDQNAAAVDAALQAERPTAPPAALSEALREQRTQRQMAADTASQQAAAEAQASAATLSPRMTAEARGSDIRGAVTTASDQAWANVGQAWDALNRSGQPVDLAPLAQTFEEATAALPEALRRKFAPAEANIPEQLSRAEPAQPTGLLDAQGNPIMRQPATPERTIQEVTGLRSALASAKAEALDRAGGANEARILQGYIDRIDSYLDTSIPPQLRDQYEAARAARVEYGNRFEVPQTAIAQTLKEQHGQPQLHPSAVAPKFVQPEQGRLSDFQDLMREAGTDPRARGAVRDQLLQEVRDRGLLDQPDALNAFIGEYRTVLDQFPDLRNQLTTAGGQSGTAAAMRTAQEQLRRELGTETTKGTTPAGKYLSWSDSRSAEAMQEVISSRKPGEAAEQLLASANNSPEAIQGARAAFWEHLQGQARSKGGTTGALETGAQPWLGGKLQNFLKDPKNMEVARVLWKDNPEHLANIEKIATAMQGLDLRLSAKAPASSGTAQGVLPSAESIGALTLAMQRGQIGPAWLFTRLASMVSRRAIRGARAEAYEKLLDQALLNPDLASALMKNNNPANREALRKMAKAWIPHEADTLVNMLSAEEEPSEEEAAIGRKAGAQ